MRRGILPHGRRGGNYFALESFLNITAACVRVDGWVSRKKASESYPPIQATADAVLDVYFGTGGSAEVQAWREARKPNESDIKLATSALEWIRGEDIDTSSDYMYNLTTACKHEAMSTRFAGIVASLMAAYMRHLAELKASESSQHIGTLKKREVFTLTVLSANPYNGDYGTCIIYRFADPNGNIAVWFNSGKEELVVGETYRIRGTVTRHDTFRGVKQTSLNRCVVED